MKTIYTYLFCGCLTLLATSCNDWFDGAIPKDQKMEDQQFADEIGITTVLNGFYTAMAEANLYGQRLTTTDIELMAHYYYYEDAVAGSDPYQYFKALTTYDYKSADSQGAYHAIWKDAYTLIYRINRFIARLEQGSVLTAEKSKLYLGEAYGLRAYLHFDLFRLFGNVEGTQLIPYNNTAKVVPHDPVADVETFKQILFEDLNKAKELLQDDPIKQQTTLQTILGNPGAGKVDITVRFEEYARNYRLNCYAVDALEARMRMFFGQTAEAADIAQTLITQLLGEDKDSAKPFYWADKQLVGGGGFGSEYDYMFFSEVLFGLYNINKYTDWEAMTSGSTAGKVYAVFDSNLRYNLYRNDRVSADMRLWEDLRAQQWHASGEIVQTRVSYKYSSSSGTTATSNNNFMQPMLRLSEMYLIVLENLLKQGKLEDAIKMLDNLRFRRGIQYGSMLEPATIEQAYDFLETEYYKEFYGEGQSFFFMKRRQRKTIIDPQQQGMIPISATQYTVPIPEAELNN